MPKDNIPFSPGARVSGYFRDSGGDEQDLSVSRQLAEFRRWLEEHGLVEGAIFTDAARPGSSVVGREAFQRMLRHFRSGAPEAGLVIWRSNRFGRNVEDSQFYKADLRRQGYLVYSLTDKIPPDRYGKLIEFVLDWKDEEFLQALGEDVKSGLRHIVETYGAVPGTPPHGFLREPVKVGLRRDGRPHLLHRWVPDQTLAPLVRRAAAQLEMDGLSRERVLVAGPATAGDLERLVETVKTVLENSPAEEVRQVLGSFIHKIVVQKRDGQINGSINYFLPLPIGTGPPFEITLPEGKGALLPLGLRPSGPPLYRQSFTHPIMTKRP